MTLTMMAALGARNTYAVCEIFEFITSVHGEAQLHPLVREKKVMVEFAQQRISSLDRCSESWIRALTTNVQEPLSMY